jgi:hypothetical protein
LTRPCSAICLPVVKDAYVDLIDGPKRFRDRPTAFRDYPERSPRAFADGYAIKDDCPPPRPASAASSSVGPSFVQPYMAALTDDVQGPLFLRAFGVPFWAIARLFGKGPSYWYRPEVSLDATASLAPPCARPLCPDTCWTTSTSGPATAKRTTPRPPWAVVDARAPLWPKRAGPRTCRRPTRFSSRRRETSSLTIVP